MFAVSAQTNAHCTLNNWFICIHLSCGLVTNNTINTINSNDNSNSISNSKYNNNNNNNHHHNNNNNIKDTNHNNTNTNTNNNNSLGCGQMGSTLVGSLQNTSISTDWGNRYATSNRFGQIGTEKVPLSKKTYNFQ